MKIRCAHLTVQLVVRQGRDVKGNSPFIIEVAPRYQRPHTDCFLCVGFFHIFKLILKEEKFYDN
ncbi:hypothetical protein B0176_04910 [Streptococcus oralis]|nr:hypothetical protein A4222_07735 [Streptococcus oralis]OOR78147.1 hypothetical protein B0176_04910 [Streptococcus oralis]